MRSFTALDVITSSMRLIGTLASGETPSDAEASDALDVLNGMVDSWQAERLMIFSTQRVVTDSNGNPLMLTSGKQSYTVGTGGDFDIPRPARIDTYSVINLANAAQPLELPLGSGLTDDEWQGVPVKNTFSSLPVTVWNDLSYPFMTLWYWPIPNTAVGVALYIWQSLSEFVDLTTDYTFPPGYYEALRYNLAGRLIAEYPGNYTQEVLSAIPILALSAIAKVKSFNAPVNYLLCDEALVGRTGFWNYRTGDFQRTGGRG